MLTKRARAKKEKKGAVPALVHTSCPQKKQGPLPSCSQTILPQMRQLLTSPWTVASQSHLCRPAKSPPNSRDFRRKKREEQRRRKRTGQLDDGRVLAVRPHHRHELLLASLFRRGGLRLGRLRPLPHDPEDVVFRRLRHEAVFPPAHFSIFIRCNLQRATSSF